MPLQTSLDRRKLQRLADRYAMDAATLLKNRRWSSAYYLSGYAIECALKACIAKQIRKHEFPDKDAVRDWYIHDLGRLLGFAGLTNALATRGKQSDRFADNWEKVIKKWRETSRYEQPTQAMAEEMFRAVSDTREGVLPWIKGSW